MKNITLESTHENKCLDWGGGGSVRLNIVFTVNIMRREYLFQMNDDSWQKSLFSRQLCLCEKYPNEIPWQKGHSLHIMLTAVHI